MKIGILQTGLAPDALRDTHGEYPPMFARLLGGHGFDFDTYAVVNGEFPDGPDAAEGWLITGSKHGVYEDHPWIAPLEELIRGAYAAEIPVVGVCFGHQIIAQALGGRVEKFTGGWAVGPQTYRFGARDMTIQAWHQDQVVELPEDAEPVATSDFCRYPALVYGSRAFSVQPHPEYGAEFIGGLIASRGKGVVPDDLLAQATERLDTPLDSAEMGAQIAHFFKHRSLP